MKSHSYARQSSKSIIRLNRLIQADAQQALRALPAGLAQAVLADPPYYRVLKAGWDNQWHNEGDYIDWSISWVDAAMRVLRDDGLLLIFGQRGKREHVFFHLTSALCRRWQYHDTLIWDRVVGYNSRRDSFDPAYEEILMLRKNEPVKFRKERLRLTYPPELIERYARDKRYTDKSARRRHLEQGKYFRNIIRVPSLRGSSKEKCGHPTQKPLKLMRYLILASTDPGDVVLDPFLGSGTTAAAAECLGRQWLGIEQSLIYCKMANRRLAQVRGVQGAFTLNL